MAMLEVTVASSYRFLIYDLVFMQLTRRLLRMLY